MLKTQIFELMKLKPVLLAVLALTLGVIPSYSVLDGDGTWLTTSSSSSLLLS